MEYRIRCAVALTCFLLLSDSIAEEVSRDLATGIFVIFDHLETGHDLSSVVTNFHREISTGTIIDSSDATLVRQLFPAPEEGALERFIEHNLSSARANLRGSFVIEFRNARDADSFLSLASSHPSVKSANKIGTYSLSSGVSGIDNSFHTVDHTKAASTQWNLALVDAFEAKELAGGGSRIATLDSGIDVNNPFVFGFPFSPSSPNSFVGSSFVPHVSYNFTRDLSNGDFCTLVDENTGSSTIGYIYGPCSDSTNKPSAIGHGTHVNSIANGPIDSPYSGVCSSCTLAVGNVHRRFSSGWRIGEDSIALGATEYLDRGFASISFSFGDGDPDLRPEKCEEDRFSMYCLLGEHARDTGSLLMAAAGNTRRRLEFPANDEGYMAIGGIDQFSNFWDEAPGEPFSECPDGEIQGCGSNYSWLTSGGIGREDARTDVVAPAAEVESLFYRNAQWNNRCFDAGGGVGFCTGTSMAAPHILGMAGVLKSVLPTMGVGDQTPGSIERGLRTIINESGDRARVGQPHDRALGFGLPSVAYAVRALLGTSDGVELVNRLTPLFSQYSDELRAFHYSVSPQVAQHKAILHRADAYRSVGAEVPGYLNWPIENFYSVPGNTVITPMAEIYIFTTKNNPFSDSDMTPLYRMTKREAGRPPGVESMVFATTRQEVDNFAMQGYRYEGIEGFILPTCDSPPAHSCAPVGAVEVFRSFSLFDSDYAIYPSTIASSMQSTLGYSQEIVSLGYVFLNEDADDDLLVDGQELILGTDPLLDDSDCDGVQDGEAYPPHAPPESDPLAGSCRDPFEPFVPVAFGLTPGLPANYVFVGETIPLAPLGIIENSDPDLDVIITDISLAAGSTTEFLLDQGSCSPFPMTLSPTQSCDFEIFVTPNAAGTLSQDIVISNNSETPQIIRNAAVSAAVRPVSIMPTIVDLGSPPSSTFAPVIVTSIVNVSNVGQGTSEIIAASEQWGRLEMLGTSTCIEAPSKTLLPGESCQFEIRFTVWPDNEGVPISETYTFGSNSPIALGIPQIAIVAYGGTPNVIPPPP